MAILQSIDITVLDAQALVLSPTRELATQIEKPSAIQQRAILPITQGRDVIAQAQSGTGKTATFSIAIVLSPTQELATQIEKPSAIQQRAILPITQGRDVIAQAQSGTGKTATFSIAILQSIDITVLDTQALVLSPTRRELATQIQSVVLALGDNMNV